MFNVGGPEVLVILLVALIVLGPQQLPKAVRSVGNVMSELRRMSSGFQDEIRNAIDAPIEADAREQGARLARTPEEADVTETVARNDTPIDEPHGPLTNGQTGSNSLGADSGDVPAHERPPIVTNPSDRAAG
jgi:sec-independent protein translocase protein TatB